MSENMDSACYVRFVPGEIPEILSVSASINPANRQGICDMITTWKKKMPASSAQSNKRRSAR